MFSHMETGVTNGCNAGFLQAANNDAELMVQDRGNPGFRWNQERLVVWNIFYFSIPPTRRHVWICLDIWKIEWPELTQMTKGSDFLKPRDNTMSVALRKGFAGRQRTSTNWRVARLQELVTCTFRQSTVAMDNL